MTKEHVWPDWLAALLPKTPLTSFRLAEGDRELSSWKAKATSARVAIACEDCNHHWMSDLEGTAKPLLTPIITKHQTKLNTEEQKDVATWAVKTVIVLQHMFPERLSVPPADPERLRKDKRPSPSTQVFLAAYDATKWDTYYYANGLVVDVSSSPTHGPDSTHGYAATIAIRHLTLQVISTSIESGFFRHAPEVEPFIIQIWPTLSGRVVWPPSLALNTSLLDSFARHFSGS